MYAANVYSVPSMQYGVQQQDQNSTPRPSPRLLGCGVTLCIISTLLCFWCFWIISISSRFYINYGTIFCCIYHIVLSVLAIIASRDVVKYRQQVLACLGLSIFGVAVLTSLVFILNCISWMSSRIACDNCYVRGLSDRIFTIYACKEICSHVTTIHLPVVIISALQGILDIIISIFNCIDTCQCCGAYAPVSSTGYIIQPPSTNNPPFSDQFQYNQSNVQPPFNPPTEQPPHNSPTGRPPYDPPNAQPPYNPAAVPPVPEAH